jgi:hypothetical protein
MKIKPDFGYYITDGKAVYIYDIRISILYDRIVTFKIGTMPYVDYVFNFDNLFQLSDFTELEKIIYGV